MPAFLSISFVFEKPVSATLVRDFYTHFLDGEISFSQVFTWGCDPKMPLGAIIDWNQNQIDKNSIPLGDTPVSQYPRQILLSIEGFSTARLILRNSEDHVEFICIVPQGEVRRSNMGPIEKASHHIWTALPVRLIETYEELDVPVGLSGVRSGCVPSCRIFALVETACKLSDIISVTKLERGYWLRPLKPGFPE